MIETRKLTEAGLEKFQAWLSEYEEGTLPPKELWNEEEYSSPAFAAAIDPDKKFTSRYAFGVYLAQQFVNLDLRELLSKESDGLWAWLAVVYFSQLSVGKPKKSEHYVVTRKGPKGSLAYRHGVRTSFELVSVHRENARVCLSVPMGTWGDMAEQLTGRVNIAHNRGFFEAAHRLYMKEGMLKRGAASRARRPNKRAPGETRGFGGAGRLALALRRLHLTFDTEIMSAESMIGKLPKEFHKWLS